MRFFRAPKGKGGRLGALRHSDFRWFSVARLSWAMASQILTVSVGYQVYTISRDPFDLGLIGLSQFLPFFVLTLPAGHIADSFDRRHVLALCYTVLTACAAALALVTLSDPTNTGPIIVLMILYGSARALALPTSTSIVPNLVPSEDFPSAVAFNSTSLQIATVVGPAMGGILLVGGPDVAYLATVGLLLLSSSVVLRLRRGGRSPSGRGGGAPSVDTLLSGLRFVRSQPIVLGSISLDMFAVLLGGAVALLPIYATDILGVGPAGLGLLRAAPAAGALVTALALGLFPLRRKAGSWLLGSVAAFGFATVGFAVSTSFVVALGALALMGCTDMVSVYVRNLLVQLSTPDSIRGRVSAVDGVFTGASNELGEFESGVTAAWWGPVAAAAVGGLLTIGVVIVWAGLFPGLRRLDRFPEPASPVRFAVRAEGEAGGFPPRPR